MKVAVSNSYTPSWAGLHLSYYYDNTNINLTHNYIRSLNVMILRGELEIDSKQTFDLVSNQVKNHLYDPLRDSLRIYMNFVELNLSARHYLMEIIGILNVFHRKGNEIIVYWSIQENSSMRQIGVELSKACDFPFEIVNV